MDTVNGPLGGLFLCKVPPDTTIRVTRDDDCLLRQPFGKESKGLTTTGKSSYVFFVKGELKMRKRQRENSNYLLAGQVKIKTGKASVFQSTESK